MPIYEYLCGGCDNRFELFVRRQESAVPACPSCESTDVEQLLSGFAVSSEGISQTRVRAASRELANSGQTRDKRVAESEYFQKAKKEHREG